MRRSQGDEMKPPFLSYRVRPEFIIMFCLLIPLPWLESSNRDSVAFQHFVGVFIAVFHGFPIGFLGWLLLGSSFCFTDTASLPVYWLSRTTAVSLITLNSLIVAYFYTRVFRMVRRLVFKRQPVSSCEKDISD